jgi:hypothetical protein
VAEATATAAGGAILADTPTVDDRAFAIDAAVIGLVSLAIALWSQELALMTLLVPALLMGRFVLWSRCPEQSRGHGARTEGLLCSLCLAFGAFNDWSSVVRHQIYDYQVPHYFPELSTIPIWMLLYWGMILRFFVSLCRWRRLVPPLRPDDRLRGLSGDRPWLKLGVQVALVMSTRQAIYRLYDDPWWSWLPFAFAIGTWLLLFRPSRHDAKLLALFAVGGPGIEILYIQVGGLHQYALGWLGGVPLWIALWWLLAVLVGQDLSARLLRVASARTD